MLNVQDILRQQHRVWSWSVTEGEWGVKHRENYGDVGFSLSYENIRDANEMHQKWLGTGRWLYLMMAQQDWFSGYMWKPAGEGE